ncbi:MAG: hypothetical protein ACLFUU_00285 [Desulfobacteraceae bacterium]
MDDYLISNRLLPWFLEGLLEELLAEEEVALQDQPNAELFMASRMEGYLSKNWFGPFLLGPKRHNPRGHC